MMTRRTRNTISRALCSAVLVVLSASPGRSDDDKIDPRADYAEELPRIPPRSPAVSLADLEILPGFRVELVASEPLVVDPVAVSFDEAGRMFVVCMRGYSENPDEFLGQVRVLEDTDGDGKFDTGEIFLDGLSWPTGVICYDGGAFVAVAPDILFCKDTDGDGKADQKRRVFTGFGRSNVQGLVNSLRWGLDNRIHGATSTIGGTISTVGRSVKPVLLRRRDFSFDPRSGELEVESGGAQHGLSFDDWGRKFMSANSRHIEMVMFEERYMERNPFLAAGSPREMIAIDGAQAEVFRLSSVEPWRIVRTRLRVAGVVSGPVEGGGRSAGYFTGATGVTIYRGNAWPEEYLGQAFIGDVGSNIVHRKILEPVGVGFRARRADSGREFLASREIWFRPVQFANAPDGTLYVLDMHREVIEHPNSLPPMIKKHLDLTSGRDRGRIYRVVPEGFRQPGPPRLDGASTKELVKSLVHQNGWHRDTAARLLYERQDLTALAPLLKQLEEARLPRGRLHTLHALSGLGAITPRVMLVALRDPHPGVREHALRLVEPMARESAELRAALYAMASDPSIRVRYQLAFTLGELRVPDDRRDRALLEIARRDGQDAWVRLAIQSSLGKGAGTVFTLLAGDREFLRTRGASPLLVGLAGQIAREKHQPTLDMALESLDMLERERPEIATLVVREIARGLRKRGDQLEKALSTSPSAARVLRRLLEDAREVARGRAHELNERVEAIGTLALSTPQRDSKLLSTLLDHREPKEVQLATLRALSRLDSSGIARTILESWSGFTPLVRAQATEVLFARKDRIGAVLQAIESDLLRASDLEPARIEFLRTHEDRGIRLAAKEAFSGVKLRKPEDVVRSYRPALSLERNPERGEAIFKRDCVACHKLGGEGHETGPTLRGLGERGAETVLLAILDPNREVHPQYLNYTLVTRDGRLLTGMIVAESATSVTLVRQEGQRESVLRIDIESLQSTGLSLMPEGLEKQIDQQGMADLLGYLLSVK